MAKEKQESCVETLERVDKKVRAKKQVLSQKLDTVQLALMEYKKMLEKKELVVANDNL